MMNSKKTNKTNTNTNNNNARHTKHCNKCKQCVNFPEFAASRCTRITPVGVFVEGVPVKAWLKEVQEETSKAWDLATDAAAQDNMEEFRAQRRYAHALMINVSEVLSYCISEGIELKKWATLHDVIDREGHMICEDNGRTVRRTVLDIVMILDHLEMDIRTIQDWMADGKITSYRD